MKREKKGAKKRRWKGWKGWKLRWRDKNGCTETARASLSKSQTCLVVNEKLMMSALSRVFQASAVN